MKKILLITVFGLLSYQINSASAVPAMKAEDFNASETRGGGTIGTQFSTDESSGSTGESCSPQYNKECNGIGQEGFGQSCGNKYTACKCKSQYKLCDETEDGSGDYCSTDGGLTKYFASCTCKQEYDKECKGDGEVPFEDKSCNEKYQACTCESSWRTCPGDAGRGRACTADGGLKYASCLPGGVVESCYHMGDVFNGAANTKEMLAGWGNEALAAKAANTFYAPGVAANHADFGQGKWYLPAIGELMDLYGYDWNDLYSRVMNSDGQSPYGSNSVTGDTISVVNTALSTLKDKGAAATTMTFGSPGNPGNCYLSSSMESYTGHAASANQSDYKLCKDTISSSVVLGGEQKVRVSTFLDNAFKNEAVKPAVGDVMYSDKSYGKAANYDGSKTAIGVVYWTDGNSARVINLKDLTFTATETAGNFNPQAPYGSKKNEGKYVSNYTTVNVTPNAFRIDLSPFGMLYLSQSAHTQHLDYNNGWEFGWKVGLGELHQTSNCGCDSSWIACPYDNGSGEACTLDGRKKFASCNDTGNHVCSAVGLLHDGRANTQAILAQLGDNALAAKAANDYYPAGLETDEHFGRGKWYLPALGEAVDMHGADDTVWDAIIQTSPGLFCQTLHQKIGANRTKIINALTAINNSRFSSIATSTEGSGIYVFDVSAWDIIPIAKTANIEVRPVTILENAFDANQTKPQVGDIMYSDMSYGAAGNYDNTKTAVGVVYWVSADGNTARILSAESKGTMAWASEEAKETDVEGVENMISADNTTCYISLAAKERCPIAE